MSLANIWDFIINVNLFYVFGGIVVLIIIGWISDQSDRGGFDDEDSDNKQKSKVWLWAIIWVVLFISIFGFLFFID